MAWIKVATYQLSYESKRKQCNVGITFRKGGSEDGELLKELFEVEPTTAVYLADMLRNEKPVWFDPDTGKLRTAREEVGEEES